MVDIADNAMRYINHYVAWEGELDLGLEIRPNVDLTWSDADGLMPANGSFSWNGFDWVNNTLQEALTGRDPILGDIEVGATIYLSKDGTLKNYGFPIWLDPSPNPFGIADVPEGTHDFYGILVHEIFHCLGFAGATRQWSANVTEINGFNYFSGPNTISLLGAPLVLSGSASGSHYGNGLNSSSQVVSGLMYEFGNYEQNRLEIGQLDLAVLKDLGYTITNYDELALVDEIDTRKEWLIGYGEAEVFRIDLGERRVDGRGELDLAVFSGSRGEYEQAIYADSLIVADRLSGRDGVSRLRGIERLEFSDTSLAFDTDGPTSTGGIYRLYKATFNREPDTGGLGYWISQADAGTKDAVRMAEDFTWSEEFQDLYDITTTDNYGTGTDVEALVTSFYENVLGRTPDQGGLDFYTGVIESRERTVGRVLAEIADSQENYDGTIELIAKGIVFDPWVG